MLCRKRFRLKNKFFKYILSVPNDFTQNKYNLQTFKTGGLIKE